MKFAILLLMDDLKVWIDGLVQKLEKLRKKLDIPSKNKRIADLESRSADQNLWNDQDKARGILQELADLKREVAQFEELSGTIATLGELSRESALTSDLRREIAGAEKDLEKLELRS